MVSPFFLFSVINWRYYTLAIPDRPLDLHHPDLRSSGSVGLVFGVVGMLLMFLNLSYLIRKRFASIVWLGSFRNWMAFHVFTGLIGPGLILLHSTYVIRSPLATLSSAAMIIVVVTGVLGRFLYAHVPRSIEGRELELEEVHRQLSDCLTELRASGVAEKFLERAVSKPMSSTSANSIIPMMVDVIKDDLAVRKEFRQLKKDILRLPAVNPKVIIPIAKQLCRQRRLYFRYKQLRHLMGGWRFFHRWLAIIMLLTIVFHLFVAIRYGDLWIFPGAH